MVSNILHRRSITSSEVRALELSFRDQVTAGVDHVRVIPRSELPKLLALCGSFTASSLSTEQQKALPHLTAEGLEFGEANDIFFSVS